MLKPYIKCIIIHIQVLVLVFVGICDLCGIVLQLTLLQ